MLSCIWNLPEPENAQIDKRKEKKKRKKKDVMLGMITTSFVQNLLKLIFSEKDIKIESKILWSFLLFSYYIRFPISFSVLFPWISFNFQNPNDELYHFSYFKKNLKSTKSLNNLGSISNQSEKKVSKPTPTNNFSTFPRLLIHEEHIIILSK